MCELCDVCVVCTSCVKSDVLEGHKVCYVCEVPCH